MPQDLIVIGAGGSSREIADSARSTDRGPSQWTVLGFLDDGRAGEDKLVEGLPILGGLDAAARFSHCKFMIGIADYSNPALRRTLVERLGLPPERYATIIDPRASVSPYAEIGPGSVVLPGCLVSPGVRIGSHVIVSQGTAIAHDSSIGDYVTIAPGVLISGNVTIEHSAYLGSGAILAPGIRVGDEALVGMSTSVFRSVDGGSTIVGNPPRVIRSRDAGTQRWKPARPAAPPQ